MGQADPRGTSGAYVGSARLRLTDQWLEATEELIDHDLTLGRHKQVATEFQSLLDAHPMRERLRGHLMLALYRSGRQVEALDVYREMRRALGDGQGINPGPRLQELAQAILRGAAELRPPGPAASPHRLASYGRNRR